jgi:hypothetical protein
MNEISIQDKSLIWTFDISSIFIVATAGTRKLSMYWADDLGISIDDTADDSFLTDEEIQTEFLIPIDSVFYDTCKESIPDGYRLFSDAKPENSKKRVEFNFVSEGLRIYIDSDYKGEFDMISSSLTFYGSNGGSSQEPGYKENFINLLRNLIAFVTDNKSKLVDSNAVKKKD